MEIYTKELTYLQAAALIEKAQSKASAPRAARDEILYEVLKNCARHGNAGCMEQVLEQNPDVDLDQRGGYLLLWSVSTEALRQGRQGVEPFKVLVAHGADLAVPDFQKNLDFIRGSRISRPRDLSTYLYFVEKGLGAKPLYEGLEEDTRLKSQFDARFVGVRDMMLEAVASIRATLSLQRQFLHHVRPDADTYSPAPAPAPQA